jgi:Spy/CpxP family protein refolding chaperone
MNMKRFAVVASAAVIVLAAAWGTTSWVLSRATPRAAQTLDVAGAHRWVEGLGLSDDQKTRLAPLEAALQEDTAALQRDLAEEKMALCGLLADEKTGEKELDVYVTRVADLQARQQRRVVRYLWDLRGLLTPPQREKLFTGLMMSVCEQCGASRNHGAAGCLCHRHAAAKAKASHAH